MFRSVNPATGEEIATYEELSPAELDAKVDKAVAAFRHWRTTDLSERTALLSRIADCFEANKQRLARMASLEMGKTLASAVAEVDKCIAGFHVYAKDGPSMLEPERQPLAAGGTAELRWLPIGPVLAIMPWNFPYWQAVRFLAPAIMAGNVGLLKHASIVQGAAGLLEEMVTEAGGPEGLFQNLAIKSGAVAGLIADDRIAAVTLTGSEGAGRSVAEAAGKALKKVVLELGGSDPFIIMPSADLDEAVKQGVKARVQNTGQSCVCAKRMIVHADVHDAFLAKFAAAMKAVKAGDPFDPQTDMGPLSSFEQRDTVLKQLEEAKGLGATLLFGGEKIDGPGAFVTAGILTNVPLDSPLAAEEIFGPIAMLFRAADLDDAIRIANHIPFGLGSSAWTKDPAEQERFIRDIEAGMTAINEMLASAPEAPFGGVKRSGHGRELSRYGLHEFMNLKTVMHAADAPQGARTGALD
ncbi:MAG: NAD-dependent succinate-semialdehyde dehydrogenase [Alphaproteobacteria bacterium]|nr:NAD-dependent succinate-semialdehyde dehydrogenase [Alphaproteobacteria bacterium]